MANVDPGEPKYGDGDRITKHSANGAGERGNAVTFGADGGLILTDGTNGFVGVQGTTPDGAGDSVALQVQGIVPVYVSAAVSEGDAVIPGANGVFDPDGVAGVGDLKVMSDSEDGIAEVLL